MSDLLRERIRVSPYGYFDVSNGSLLGILTVLLTYMIVLVQFRVND